jgi:hypothetical protein
LSGWAALAVHVFRQPGKDRTLHIAYAGYGLGGDRYKDVTILVRGYIKSNKLNVPVSNETFLGDPYGGAKKHIVIRYRIGSGREVEIVRHEHDQLILPTDEDQTAVMRPVTLGERSRHLGDELLQFLAEKGPEPDLSYVKKIPIEVALKEVSKLYDPWLDGVYYGYEHRFRDRVLNIRAELKEALVSDPALDSAIDKIGSRTAASIETIAEDLILIGSRLQASKT